MIGDDIRSASDYRPGEGYKPADAFSPRGILSAACLGAAYFAADWLVESILTELDRGLVHLCLSAFGAGYGLWMVLRPEHRDEQGAPINLGAVLYPERLDRGLEAERRGTRLWGFIILIASLVIAAFSIRSLFFPE